MKYIIRLRLLVKTAISNARHGWPRATPETIALLALDSIANEAGISPDEMLKMLQPAEAEPWDAELAARKEIR